MKDNRSEKVKQICESFVNHENGCNDCPLNKPCQSNPGDTKDIFDKRMNIAAEVLK